MLALSLALAFGPELAALAAFGVWGARTGPNLGVGAPLLIAVFWGALLSPRAAFPPPPPLRWSLKPVIFAAAVGALFAARYPAAGLGFAFFVALYLASSAFVNPSPSDLERFGSSG